MSDITDEGNQVWRDYVVDGVQGSGDHEPVKSEVRAWAATVDGAITDASESIEATIAAAEASIDASVDAASGSAAGATIASMALATYIGAGVEVVAPISGLVGVIVSNDGKMIYSQSATDTAVPPQVSASFFARASGRGTKIESDAVIRTVNSGVAYTGPIYDGALYLQAPVSGGAQVNWDRKSADWRDITIGASYVTLDADLAGDVIMIFPTFGQSLSAGGPPSYTDVAPDEDNLLMPSVTSTWESPYMVPGFEFNGLRPLAHENSVTYGETTLASMGLQLLVNMNTAGLKIPGVYFTAGAGGHSLRDLNDDMPNYALVRTGGAYANLMRCINYARQQIEALGKIPMLMPLVFIHGEEDNGDWNIGTPAIDYRDGLIALKNKYNRDVRRIMNWSQDAPDLPMLITQTRRTMPYMWSASTTKRFTRGVDGPMLGQWGAAYKDPGIVMCGPNYYLPNAGDGSHLNGGGYFRLGEQIARQMWACTFGVGPKYFRPIACIRQSATIVDIVFQVPSGSLAFDTTVITDHADSNKGFYAWDGVTGAAIAIASVAVQAADTIRVTFSSSQADTVQPWIDGGLWGNDSSNLAATTTGPRLNLRTNTAYTSLISDYGGSATTDYDWCPAFRIPVTYYGGSARTGRLDGRL